MTCREYLKDSRLQCKHRRRQRKQMRRVVLIGDRSTQFVRDMNADYLVERGIAAKSERKSTSWIEPARPARHNTGDQWIGLATDAGRHFVAGDPPQGGDLFGHGTADARHGEIDAGPEFGRVEAGCVDQKSGRGARTGVPMQHAVRDRKHRLLAGKRLTNDRGEEPRSGFVWLARPHHNARKPDADAGKKAAAGIVGEQKFNRRFLRSIGSQRGKMKLVGDGIGEWRTEHRYG